MGQLTSAGSSLSQLPTLFLGMVAASFSQIVKALSCRFTRSFPTGTPRDWSSPPWRGRGRGIPDRWASSGSSLFSAPSVLSTMMQKPRVSSAGTPLLQLGALFPPLQAQRTGHKFGESMLQGSLVSRGDVNQSLGHLIEFQSGSAHPATAPGVSRLSWRDCGLAAGGRWVGREVVQKQAPGDGWGQK